MCKHVAAVLDGVGARLDYQPEFLFRLNQVDQGDLITKAATGLAGRQAPKAGSGVLDGQDFAGMFGRDLAGDAEPVPVKNTAFQGEAPARKRKTTK